MQKRRGTTPLQLLEPKEDRGIIFFVSPETMAIAPAISLAGKVIGSDFKLSSMFIFLNAPEQMLPERVKERVRRYSNVMHMNDLRRQTAIFINTNKCHSDTILLTQQLDMKSIFIDLDVNILTEEEVVRKAIVKILKAI